MDIEMAKMNLDLLVQDLPTILVLVERFSGKDVSKATDLQDLLSGLRLNAATAREALEDQSSSERAAT